METATNNRLTAKIFAENADHTLLAADTTPEKLEAFLVGAVELGVKRVCVSPNLLPVDKRGLEIVTVVGFPSGAHKAAIKAAEAKQAVLDGADEVDMVVNAALIKAADWDAVAAEISAVKAACDGKPLKVILETANLSDEEIVLSAKAAAAAGADFVKTSTGFHSFGGASAHAVKLMAETVGESLGVKASGGIRTAADAQKMWDAGATRFGVSATAEILRELRGESRFSSAATEEEGY